MGAHVLDWNKITRLPCTIRPADMQMKARGKKQCTIVRFVLGLQRSFDKTRQPMAMATLLLVSSASAKAPPRPNLVMSIRNIELMFVNSQLCKTWSTPLKKKHSIAGYSLDLVALLAMPFFTSPCNHLIACNSLFNYSSIFFFVIHLLPKN